MLSSISLLHPTSCVSLGILVREAASEREQQALYGKLCSSARGTQARLAEANEDEPTPLCVWQHPYSRQSNAEKPASVIDFAHALARRTASELRECNDDDALAAAATAIDHSKYDSLVSLLYGPGAALRPHVDKGMVGYGLALSFGASATFDFGGTRVVLRSGDALFADFGAVRHAVLTTHSADSAPAWWAALAADADEAGASTFGRSRCSLQLRDRVWSLRPHPTRPGSYQRRCLQREPAYLRSGT